MRQDHDRRLTALEGKQAGALPWLTLTQDTENKGTFNGADGNTYTESDLDGLRERYNLITLYWQDGPADALKLTWGDDVAVII